MSLRNFLPRFHINFFFSFLFCYMFSLFYACIYCLECNLYKINSHLFWSFIPTNTVNNCIDLKTKTSIMGNKLLATKLCNENLLNNLKNCEISTNLHKISHKKSSKNFFNPKPLQNWKAVTIFSHTAYFQGLLVAPFH